MCVEGVGDGDRGTGTGDQDGSRLETNIFPSNQHSKEFFGFGEAVGCIYILKWGESNGKESLRSNQSPILSEGKGGDRSTAPKELCRSWFSDHPPGTLLAAVDICPGVEPTFMQSQEDLKLWHWKALRVLEWLHNVLIAHGLWETLPIQTNILLKIL